MKPKKELVAEPYPHIAYCPRCWEPTRFIGVDIEPGRVFADIELPIEFHEPDKLNHVVLDCGHSFAQFAYRLHQVVTATHRCEVIVWTFTNEGHDRDVEER